MKIKRVTSEADLESAFDVRREVFIKEQGVDYDLEMDGKDSKATHFIVKKETDVIATCRLRKNKSQGKLERMAVRQSFRRQGVGSKLLDHVIDYAQKEGLSSLLLHAQKRVVDFYQQLGFKVISDDYFQEAGIDHLKMKLKL